MPASADTLRSDVGFNTGIGQQTADQPANGNTVAYQITLAGGALDGCTVDVSSPFMAATKANGASSTSPAT
ncbi:MAG: hypothetical protein HC871_03765 [Rhizobiales bacterium]|nr:hypothetical protein [Hyphomicrobiales bacterium]